MLQEIKLMAPQFGNEPLESIYIGGGTPSFLPVSDLQMLFAEISNYWNLNELKECTIEANPDDINAKFLKEIKSTPVNRFSLGIQSFRNADLQWMNRAHNAQQSDTAIKAAQDAGFQQLTIDLIYATPGLTDEDWLENLAQLQAYQIPHFSAYALTVEEGTALHHGIKMGKTHPPEEERVAQQMRLLQRFALENNWDHYEISNLCQPGNRAVHNSNYWRGLPYLGIGPSAHSFHQLKRWWNVSNNALYCKGMETNNPDRCYEDLSIQQQFHEFILTQLRMKEGIPLQQMLEIFGLNKKQHVIHQAQKHLENGLLIFQDEHLQLSREGFLFADGIAADLFV